MKSVMGDAEVADGLITTAPVQRLRPGGFAGELTLFFAVMADAGIWAAVAAVEAAARERERLVGKPLAPERLNMSMNSLGNETSAILQRALQIGDGMSARAFEITLDVVGSFKGAKTHPLVLTASDGCGGLKMLSAMINSELRRYGFRAPRSIGTAHLTLGYYQQMAERTEIDPIRWTASEFVLMRSYVGLSRYDIVKRWALRTPEAAD